MISLVDGTSSLFSEWAPPEDLPDFLSLISTLSDSLPPPPDDDFAVDFAASLAP
ncbi:hypothetical protein RchiOBHm_Chr4g0438771 [Rosa chinensis]|uniref:Uncharacterized protein n=1 Tax=Rosa chinensis TaxID=74649 RepID=A0A2P6R2Q2_ROSCH|nr:hypothetical protein RchiOBHm_Chr4g0438771 [Rosa chinensis]